jgi:hypothetical protein
VNACRRNRIESKGKLDLMTKVFISSRALKLSASQPEPFAITAQTFQHSATRGVCAERASFPMRIL